MKQTAMLVDVTRVESGTYRPTIVAMGMVEPAREILLSPRVTGVVIALSEHFTPGGFVEKEEMLLRIDPADYENTLRQRESELRQATAALRMEMGRQDVAEQDYRLIEENLSEENEALVLRVPQLNTARAQLESARSAVEQARLELERTTIEAPFDAHVLSREVNVGSQVNPGSVLGRLVGLDTYWVMATVPLSKLPWITIPDAPEEQGAPVEIRNRAAWREGVTRQGRIHKLVGALEDDTRMARILVSVPDPLNYHAEDAEAPGLIIGAVVEVRIEGKPIRDVVRVDRNYVRDGDTAWVMAEGALQIRDLQIEFRDAEYAYVSSGLEDGDRVVTTNLSTVVDGAPLRVDESGGRKTDTEAGSGNGGGASE